MRPREPFPVQQACERLSRIAAASPEPLGALGACRRLGSTDTSPERVRAELGLPPDNRVSICSFIRTYPDKDGGYDAAMPNKTIYVSDDDLALFQRAQELSGGNLSAAIASAVRRYVEFEEGRREGYDEIVVQVGQGGARRKQRFSGVLLGEWSRTKGSTGRVELFRVYRTRKEQYALFVDRSPEWTSGKENWLEDLTNWRMLLGLEEYQYGFVQGDSTLEVFASLPEMRQRIPAELYDLIVGSVDAPAVEDLDI